MLLENINNSYITIIGLLSFIIFYIISKISKTKKFQNMLDHDFNKPQAFHNELIPRTGGLASIISLTLFFITFSLIFNYKSYEYIFFSITFFTVGFLDDIKINLKPLIRLFLMIVFLIVGLNFFDIKITKTGFSFLNFWLENDIFQYIFLILCFLFVANGSNLIDGFNGLLIIHILIINSVLLYINLNNGEENMILILSGQIIVMFCFLLFNFPKSTMFMGDGGAYLFGVLTSLNVINTSISFPEISPLFFTVLLFYLFFEVFFSFFRKLKATKSPLQPDSTHLHMLIFKFLKNRKKLNNANPKTSLLINSFFFLMLIPALMFREDGLFCRYWFLIQLFTYFLLYNFTKKLN